MKPPSIHRVWQNPAGAELEILPTKSLGHYQTILYNTQKKKNVKLVVIVNDLND